MRVKKVRMEEFKRFDDLTIDLGENPRKIVALVGPNGCGKSSVFDVFKEEANKYRSTGREDDSFYSKSLFYENGDEESSYNINNNFEIIDSEDNSDFDHKSFYVRSSYRFIPNLNVGQIQQKEEIYNERSGPKSSIDLDGRMKDNYERLLSYAWRKFDHEGDKTGDEVKEELIGKINEVLQKILNVEISSLGNVIDGEGTLKFKKENTVDFPYDNLSAGEKGVLDIIIDLIIKREYYDDTVFCIDEPELHLNTNIQRKLLIELEKLIPDNCQLWIATHSIGFLRALQEDFKEDSQVLDFSVRDYFQDQKTIKPITENRKNWQRIFHTALDDLTYLIAPKRIVYCEGRAEPDDYIEEQGLDAEVYNNIFSNHYSQTLFISAGGSDVDQNSTLALRVFNKAFVDVDLLILKDKDDLSEEERQEFLDEDDSKKMLNRRELENYLFDKEIVSQFCDENDQDFDEKRYNQTVNDINNQDLKPLQQDVQHTTEFRGSVDEFKKELSKCIYEENNVYQELENCIF